MNPFEQIHAEGGFAARAERRAADRKVELEAAAETAEVLTSFDSGNTTSRRWVVREGERGAGVSFVPRSSAYRLDPGASLQVDAGPGTAIFKNTGSMAAYISEAALRSVQPGIIHVGDDA